MNVICVDGKFTQEGKPVINIANKSYRYGDGLFETMKIEDQKIRLANYHFDRLLSGIKTLGLQMPALLNVEKLTEQILQTAEKNKASKSGRARLAISRGDGGIYEGSDELHYSIECLPLSDTVNRLNENGLIIGVYADARKSTDIFANLKSANFLPYVMAARFARQHQFNDCLVLNTDGRIADSTIANIFIIKKDHIITPPLTEGCVAGVMRRHLIKTLSVQEKALTIEDVQQAEEVFLTNAVNGIRWVKQFGTAPFTNTRVVEIYSNIQKTFQG